MNFKGSATVVKAKSNTIVATAQNKMKCSPKYKQKERQDVGQRPCNDQCFHWKACLKEIGAKDAPQEFWSYENRYKKPLFGVVLTTLKK